MSPSNNAKEQSLPLATNGYVTGVRERFVRQIVMHDGTVVGGTINFSEVNRLAFQILHSAVRMTLTSRGGMNKSIRSQGTSLQVGQKKLSMALSRSGTSLSLSKC